MLRAVTLLFRPPMHHQLRSASLLNRIGDFKFLLTAVPAQTHFHADRQMR
ncbi:Uncharacterised protein [Shigella flexneri]|nr:Uncharacterised protein [Shigella flexneri]